MAFSVNFLHSSVQKQGEAATLFLTPGHLFPCVDACCRARKAEIRLWVKSQHLLQLHFEFLHLRPSEGRDFTSGGQSSSRGNPMRAKILPNWLASEFPQKGGFRQNTSAKTQLQILTRTRSASWTAPLLVTRTFSGVWSQ